MYYAIIDTRSDVSAATFFASGADLRSLANKIIAECKKTLDEDYEDMSLDEIEEEYEDAYFDEYRALKRKRKITPDSLYGFTFSISDLSIEVAAVCDGYSSLVSAFDEYVKDKAFLSQWQMVSNCVETDEELAAMNDELLALCESDVGKDGMKYFSRR